MTKTNTFCVCDVLFKHSCDFLIFLDILTYTDYHTLISIAYFSFSQSFCLVNPQIYFLLGKQPPQ